MHTIASLRKALDLSTLNQVRNRIDAVKDILAEFLRRGPNNQILVTDEGLELLRQLQKLYDSGLTMAEASEVLRAKAYAHARTTLDVSPGFVAHDTKPSQTPSSVDILRDEIAFLRDRIAGLEDDLRQRHVASGTEESAWWTRLREDVDGS
jgi:hypothetical protein